MKMSKKTKAVIYILLTIVAIYFLAPFVYMLFTTFKTEAEAIAYPPTLFPEKWNWQNFVDAWNSQPFGTYFMNSVIVTVLTTLGQILSCSLVAYGFARFNFKGKNILFMILLATMMIPWDVTMIPQYMEFNLLGWINTLKPLIVPAFFGSAYYIFLMRQFLMGIPKDYEEAARLDGANAFQIYWKIFMPILKPSLILVGVLNMLTVWNDYLGPLIFLQDRSKYTLALGLASFKGVHDTQIIPMLCITVIMIIPPIIIFIIAQKYIVEGTSGSIK
ncbi:MAG TPA: carbohydrate ABC transporter permease [Candidatus Blautia stercoripullorum]|uniref:Carbohydrate ABC transporter permease n=1 Tax=Candidatus Blautia stercoripullorum TaxID=2838502 RepID=A0A9D2RAU3_9FIRM|nr:carbohydrate ABC transporter permease [Candidatus Blautia stercoripullorum]